MHLIQEKLLTLSKEKNLAKLRLREMAANIGMPGESPQKIKHHLLQLQKKGFLSIDKGKGTMNRFSTPSNKTNTFVSNGAHLFSIPVVGTANCGPADIFAEENYEGFLRISSKLVGRTNPSGLFAIRADGSSMNRAEVKGKRIEDGDYVIVDKNNLDVRSKDVVLVVIDNKATIKRFINDQTNRQLALIADSSHDYDPIYLHPDDDFSINGKVIAVIKKTSREENKGSRKKELLNKRSAQQ
jgi:SOS-response transcriptional repressor LexA